MPHVRARDGASLHVRTVGRGRPCVLLHGFASDSRSWLPFVAPLLHRYRFLIPDLRGFGASHEAPLESDCPLTQYAEDLEDVLKQLAVRDAALVGISMGAFAAVRSFQLFGGARFSRYMHIDQGPIIRNRDDYPHGLLGPAQPAFFARLEELTRALEGLAGEPYDALPSALRREFWTLIGEFSASAFSAPAMQRLVRAAAGHEPLMRRLLPVERWQIYPKIVRAYLERDYDLREGFRAIRVPLTVLIGGASRMYPPAGQRTIGELAPHARVREVPSAGHMLPYEAPRLFMRELSGFLA